MGEPLTDNNGIKSTAVVKYSASQSPATFAQLQCNTDLNSPPSNWLSNSASIYGLQHVLSQSTGYSSFRMTHMFPDCVGEVDVVSDAENIKNLLKLPYSRGQVSMMVHRVGNTLLIDEFDIYQHLLRTAEKEWEWLRKFYFNTVRNSFNEKQRSLYLQNKSRNVLQQKSLVSKFLYHSLVQKRDEANQEEYGNNHERESFPVSGPALPDPTIEEEFPDPNSNHKYNRNVVWTFEDIQMLIGTDMPIFGGSTHPCISLRLRDMKSPINVLTGIDYWLDNLMSNVPEVVMCYHLNGIVQKYELIKTEDLPNLENSKFSPTVIRDIAQNILSFLKSNATKAGHTYWLFKSKDDDVIKLYDLTSLCNNEKGNQDQNPFTVPVAMLLYRVARNMKTQTGRKQPGTIRMLLKNCIQLLHKEKYPQIVTSAHYMISDLYVPANTDPAAPGLEQMETDDLDSCYEDDLNDNGDDAAMKQLRLGMQDKSDNHFVYKPPPPITGTLEERCHHSLCHVAAGLECLQYFPSHEEDVEDLKRKMEQAKKREEEDNPTMAKPFQAIPMPYAKLNDTTCNNNKSKKSKKRKNKTGNATSSPNALLPKPNQEAVPSWQEPDRSDNASWCIHLKTLLYEKACVVFAILAEQDYVVENYGSCIKNINILMRCHQVLKSSKFSSRAVQESCSFGRAGDACFMIIKNWTMVDKYREQLINILDMHQKILEQLEKEDGLKDAQCTENNIIPTELISIEQLLLSAAACYDKALQFDIVQDRNTLIMRLANIQNEIGVFYTHKANPNDTKAFQENTNKAIFYLQSGIKNFDSIRDIENLALLYSNMGRLMRLFAHFHSSEASGSSNKPKKKNQEKQFYTKALENYQKALNVLNNRASHPTVWDTIAWELSSALFNRAVQLQDDPQGEDPSILEREIADMYLKALNLLDFNIPEKSQCVNQYRAATIHSRLASLYHSSLRRQNPENYQRWKQLLQLANLHYEKALFIFNLLEQKPEMLKCYLERVAVSEYCATCNAYSVYAKINFLQQCLYYLVEALPTLYYLLEKSNILQKENNNEAPETEKEDKPEESTSSLNECITYTNSVEQQLQTALKLLAKLCLNKTNCDTAEKYKALYSQTLRIQHDNDWCKLLKELINILEQVKLERNVLIKYAP